MDLPLHTLNISAVIDDVKAFNLLSFVENNKLKWIANFDCKIYIIFSEVQAYSIDPMNAISGEQVCKKFFSRFEERNPNEAGDALNFFFSDELNFGIKGMLWNDSFAKEFEYRKGYNILPYLQALFTDTTNAASKIRLDYYDVIIQLQEQNYFNH